MDSIIDNLLKDPKGVLFLVLAVLATVILIVVGALLVVLIKKALKKMGIEVDDKIINSAKDVIGTVVKYYNQTIVSELKKKSGNLTEEEKEEVYNNVLGYVRAFLTNEQFEAIIQKYGEDAELALKIVIESIVNDQHETVVALPETTETKEIEANNADEQ